MDVPKHGDTFEIAEFDLTRKDVKELKKLSEDAFRDKRIGLYEVFKNFSALNNYKFLRKQYLNSQKEK